MKNSSYLLFACLISLNTYSGVVDDHWDPGDEQGPPDCGDAGGPQGHVGNPIHAGMGNKYQNILIYEGNSTNPLKFEWHYNSESIGTDVWQYNIGRSLDPVEVNLNEYSFIYKGGDGSYSTVSLDTPVYSDSACTGSAPGQTYQEVSADGRHKISATTLSGESCEILDLVKYFNINGQVETYTYLDTQSWNNEASQLSHVDFPNGERHTYSYDPQSHELTVTHSNGRTMIISYVEKAVEVNSMALLPASVTVGSLVWTFEYEEIEISSNNYSQILKKINGPDGTSNEFLYNQEIVTGNLPNPVLKALLTDRYVNGEHAAGWVYNENYRAYRSYHGPKPSSFYEGASFFDDTQWEALELTFYPDFNYVSTVDKFGKETDYNYSVVTGYQGKKKSKLEGVYGSPTTNCNQTYESVTYDQHWRVSETTDANYQVTKRVYTSDPGSRGRLKKLTFALGNSEARVINYEYFDEDRNLVSKIVESRLTREFDYYANGRVKEIRVIDTTTHSAPYPTNGVVQKTTYAYQYYDAEQRRVMSMTIDGPRTDVADVSTVNYDNLGRVTTIVDALGHVTLLSDFNEWNFPETVSKYNVVTTLDYQNGFNKPLLISQSIGSQAPATTSYNAFELPSQITSPTGSFLKYSYKTMDEESVFLIENNLGEQTRIDREVDLVFQLESITEATFPDAGAVTPIFTETNSYDALGRLYQSSNLLGGEKEYVYNERNKLMEILESGSDGDGNFIYPYKTFDYDYGDRLVGYADNYRYTNFEYTNLDQLNKVQDAEYRNTNYVLDAFGNKIQIVSPDSKKTKYYYDEANNLIKVIDADAVLKEYSYDELNRLISMSYPGDPAQNTQFIYDGADPLQNASGRLSQVAGPGGNTTYYYNSEGNISKRIWVFDGQTYEYMYSYQNGLVSSMTYPSGRVVSYDYDALGRVSDIGLVSGGNAYELVNEIIYNPFGPMAGYDYGNGISQSFSYDTEYRLNRIISGNVLDLSYQYDSFENITEIIDNLNSSKSQSIRYDEFDQIVSASGQYGHIEYAYDNIGNRTELTTNGVYHAYEYNSAFRLNRVYNYTDFKLVDRFIHKNNGDASKVGNATINMNDADQVESVVVGGLTTSYKYNHVNQRVYKSTGNVAYHYNDEGLLIAETDAASGDTIREYYYLGATLVAALEPAAGQPIVDNLQFVHLNHLTAPVEVTDSQQQVIWSATYKPFGEIDITIEDTSLNIRFPGQYSDEESGLYYNWNRYYSPKHGRYIQSDPIGLEGGINTYAYVGANPVNAVDPRGLDILVIGGGRRTGSLNFPGHVGMAFTGRGTFSYGNDTPLGSSTRSYLESQSKERNQVVVLLPAIPRQDNMGADYLLENYPGINSVGYFDNCAVRTNEGLMAAGFPSLEIPFPGGLTRKAQGLEGAQTFVIPRNGPIPQALLDILPSFEPVSQSE